MANNIKGPVWELDTTGVIFKQAVEVQGFVFKPGSAADNVILHDASGNTIIDWTATDSVAVTPQIGMMLSRPIMIQGITLDTLDGGKLLVYTS